MLPPWNIEALNPPFGDPGFFLYHTYTGQALIFDLGDLHRLPARKLLQASHIFISHGHIDHLIGFDQLLRVTLNRPRHLHIYGPPGIIDMIGHKLQGYNWNLTSHYELLITVHAVFEQHCDQVTFACCKKFCPEPTITTTRNDTTILDNENFTVRAATLDHGTPVLAFSLTESLQINFRPEELKLRNWKPGPWLSHLRRILQMQEPTEPNIEISGVKYSVKEVAAAIAIIKPGSKITYITDIGFTKANLKKLLPLATNANLLICEAAFLNSAAEKAQASNHLTAAQAGEIAQKAQVQRLKLFHFSPRHHDLENEFYRQAGEHFSGPIS